MQLSVKMVLFALFLANFGCLIQTKSDNVINNNPKDEKLKEDGQSVTSNQQHSDNDDLDEKARKDEEHNEDLKDGEEEETLIQKKDSGEPPKAGEVPLLTSGNTAKTSKEIGAGNLPETNADTLDQAQLPSKIKDETSKRSEITDSTGDKILNKPMESTGEDKIIDKKSIGNENSPSITVKEEVNGKPLPGGNVQDVNQEVDGGDVKDTSDQKDDNDDNNDSEGTKSESSTVSDDSKIKKPGMLKRVASKLHPFKKSTKASDDDKSMPTTRKESIEEEQNSKITPPSEDIQETTQLSKESQKEKSDEHNIDSRVDKTEPTSDPKNKAGILGKLTRKLSKNTSSSTTDNVINDNDSVNIDTENDKPNNPTENEKKPGMVGKLIQNRPKLPGPNIVALFSKNKNDPTQN